MKNETQRACFSVIVNNEPGVLARVIGLFSGRGYNIESLTVSSINAERTQSRMTIVTHGNQLVIAQIRAQLEKLVPVISVSNMTQIGAAVEKEVALVRFSATGSQRREGLRIADIFKANVSDTTHGAFVFSLSGSPDKVNAFIELMSDIGEVEIVRSGVIALNRTAALSEHQKNAD